MSQGWQPGGPPPPGGYGPPTQAPATAPTQMAPAPAPTPPPGAMQPYAPYPAGSPPTQPSQQGYGQQQSYGTPPPMGAPYAQPPGYGFGQYEFNEMENAIIAKTASRAKIWGIISIVIGSLYLLSVLGVFLSPGLLVNLAPGIGGLIVGITFLGVGNSLQSVVQTQGNDIEHMMQAMQKIGSSFMTQIIVTIVQVVLYVLLALVAFLFLAAMFAISGP